MSLFVVERSRLIEEAFITDPNREPVGRPANVISDSRGRDAVVFETCYFHPYGGIWLRGSGAGRNPIIFRQTTSPTVVWAEHDNYVFESTWQPEFADETGVIYRSGKKWTWKRR